MVFVFSCKKTETIPLSSQKSILSFSFDSLMNAKKGIIDETNKQISVLLDASTDLSKLTPTIIISPKATISPDSKLFQDFSKEIIYTITAEDGSKVLYKVTVTKSKSALKEILEFRFADFSPIIEAKIDTTTKIISASFPSNADFAKLKPTIKLSDKATSNIISGTIVDFSKDLKMTINAENGSSHIYSFIFKKDRDFDILYITNTNFASSTLYAINAKNGTVVWQFESVNVLGSPSVLDNKVYFGDNKGNLYCKDAINGASIWVDFSIEIPGSDFSAGIPIFELGKNIVYMNGGKKFHAVDASNGKIIWTYTLSKTDDLFGSSATINNGKIYISTYNKSVLAIEQSTGVLKWEFNRRGFSTNNNILVSAGNLFFGDETNSFYALNETNGDLIWETKLTNSIFSSPTIKDGIVYFGCDDQKLYGLDSKTGLIKFEFLAGGNIKSSPFINSNIIYFGTQAPKSTFYAYDLVNKNVKWTYVGSSITSSPLVHTDIVFFQENRQKVNALDNNTGTILWSKTTNYLFSSFTSICILAKDGKAYYSSISGMVN